MSLVLPGFVLVKGHKWRIVLSPKLEWPKGQKNRGLCHFPERYIEIWEKQSDRRKLDALWHELGHAVEFEYGLKVPHQFFYDMERAFTYTHLELRRLNQA